MARHNYHDIMISGIIDNAYLIIPDGQAGDRVARVIFRGGHDIMIMMMTRMMMIVWLVTES